MTAPPKKRLEMEVLPHVCLTFGHLLTGHKCMQRPNTANLGPAIRDFRDRRRITGRQFAELTGIAQGHLSELENGKKNLTPSMLDRISQGMKMENETLLDELSEISNSFHNHPSRLESDPFVREREMPPYNVNPTQGAAPDDMHHLAEWFVGNLPRPEAFSLVRNFTMEAETGDIIASARARALLLLLSKPL